MTAWRAGSEDVLSDKVAKRAGVLPDIIATFDRQGTALGGNDAAVESQGGFLGSEDIMTWRVCGPRCHNNGCDPNEAGEKTTTTEKEEKP